MEALCSTPTPPLVVSVSSVDVKDYFIAPLRLDD